MVETKYIWKTKKKEDDAIPERTKQQQKNPCLFFWYSEDNSISSLLRCNLIIG